eukprot:TRINITY_DN8424_c0_g1_i11.p1 TRINITY_DN8424_c0_g1~~TRINITY_DN8424_c0_g1_i11.p1  ORF type:complete len:195 (-),score=41.41 TRINITY_DN8424_c0_g1_i11:558-1142(-)
MDEEDTVTSQELHLSTKPSTRYALEEIAEERKESSSPIASRESAKRRTSIQERFLFCTVVIKELVNKELLSSMNVHPRMIAQYMERSRESVDMRATVETVKARRERNEAEHRRKVFEAFFVVGLKEKSVSGVCGKAEVKYEYPKLSVNRYHVAFMHSEWKKTLEDFCFPKGVRVSEVKSTQSMSEAEKYFYIYT